MLMMFFVILDIDSISTFTMGHEALNYIKKGGPRRSSTSGGLILNISVTLHYTTSWYQIHVAVAKAVVDVITRNLALEWGTDYDIRVNGIAQGSIDDTVGMHKRGSEEISNKSREYMPLYKLGEKYNIAMAAMYLSSDAGW
ncbi:Peroxisomal 2,4-dienoyl-CoA reductase [Capsicum annuum]|uniref:2,4-dienoyl-CoA reductase [(3E)-enoyl-CoA-producing] n=1 Tax=Capsicum annuum TaxID=4072 RepID=A0A2G2YT89_CAPAN|nr:Peroxisomal 2,4-dienoyl-CoA reductase [Capsicum annuum]PHT72987.1 Peroxisomal 2,4-dienoyl-CoA reductase [Capsicum annuum]